MMTLVATMIVLVLVGLVVVALDRNYRRTAGLPQAPFGLDREGGRDLARARCDLEAVRSRTAG